MALWVPSVGGMKVVSNSGTVGTSTPGTSVPDGASVNTYGTVTEVISAANNLYGADAIEIMVSNVLNPSALVGQMSLDILIGGATDDVLISSLLVGGSYYGNVGRGYWFPLSIPSGVRIAAQISAGAAQTSEPRVLVNLYKWGVPPFRTGRKVKTYGTKIDNSRGVAVTPGASGAARTATQITASTSQDHFYFSPGFQVSTDTTIANATFVNVAIGFGAATEEASDQTWWFSKNASEMQSGPWPTWGEWRNVPSGTRLTILASNGSANDTAQDALIYAVS